MNEEIKRMARGLVEKYAKLLILTLDAFVGGTITGAGTALGMMHIRPDVFNLQSGLKDLAALALWSGFLGAGAYLRQRKPPPDSSGTPPPTPTDPS